MSETAAPAPAATCVCPQCRMRLALFGELRPFTNADRETGLEESGKLFALFLNQVADECVEAWLDHCARSSRAAGNALHHAGGPRMSTFGRPRQTTPSTSWLTVFRRFGLVKGAALPRRLRRPQALDKAEAPEKAACQEVDGAKCRRLQAGAGTTEFTCWVEL